MTTDSQDQLSEGPVDPRPAAEFVEAIVRARTEDEDSEAAWELVTVLRYRAARDDFECARGLLESADPLRRSVGADILAQFGFPRAFPEEVIGALQARIRVEHNDVVLANYVTALGHNDDPSSLAVVLGLATHRSADVRFAVAVALGRGGDRADVLEALIGLSMDEDDEVRDWATFGLGSQHEADTPEIREALALRLRDSDSETCSEALVGLAQRKDPRALEPLLRALRHERVGRLAVEAAWHLAHPLLLAALRDLEEWWDVSPGLLHRAIEACERSHLRQQVDD